MRTALCDLLGIRYPIILAGMAGGPTTPELVAAVSEAGGLGTFGINAMTPDAVRAAVTRARELTSAPIAVNVLLAPPGESRGSADELQRALAPIRAELGLAPPPSEQPRTTTGAGATELLEAALAAGAGVISTGLGNPAPIVPVARAARVPVIAMAATVADAVSCAAAGADVVVAQGGEAGGHRSNFQVPADAQVPLVGTMALVPQVVRAVDVPVVATGGIMDGGGLVAAIALGAVGAQFGSRFLLATESGIGSGYRERLRAARDTDSEIIVALSGRPARGLRNRLLEALEAAGSPNLGYARQAAAWSDIRAAAQRTGSADHSTLWAGQAAGLGTTDLGAAQIVAQIVREAAATVARLGALPR